MDETPRTDDLCEVVMVDDVSGEDVTYRVHRNVYNRLVYLEAQEHLLEAWQQRCKKAEATIQEIERPLDAEMARLNSTLTARNDENARLERELAEARNSIYIWQQEAQYQSDQRRASPTSDLEALMADGAAEIQIRPPSKEDQQDLWNVNVYHDTLGAKRYFASTLAEAIAKARGK